MSFKSILFMVSVSFLGIGFLSAEIKAAPPAGHHSQRPRVLKAPPIPAIPEQPSSNQQTEGTSAQTEGKPAQQHNSFDWSQDENIPGYEALKSKSDKQGENTP